MSPETRAVTCQGCGFVALRVATTIEPAAAAVEHLAETGHDADNILISPVGRRP